MKANRIFLITTVFASAMHFCNAQTIDVKPAPAGITIDGNIKEWGDNLPYVNDNAKVNYLITNDKTNLYIVVKTKDAVKQSNILGSGITISVNTRGKKKTVNSVTFPAREKEDPSQYQNLTPEQTEAKISLTKSRWIDVSGFADIKNEQLDTKNAYGIQAALGYNDGYLTYEEAIPLELFHAPNPISNEWVVDIDINGLIRSETKTIPVVYTNARSSIGGRSDAGSVLNNMRAVRVSENAPKGKLVSDNDETAVTANKDFKVKINLAKL